MTLAREGCVQIGVQNALGESVCACLGQDSVYKELAHAVDDGPCDSCRHTNNEADETQPT